MFPGLHLYDTDPAQNLRTAGWDLYDLYESDRDLSGVCKLSTPFRAKGSDDEEAGKQTKQTTYKRSAQLGGGERDTRYISAFSNIWRGFRYYYCSVHKKKMLPGVPVPATVLLITVISANDMRCRDVAQCTAKLYSGVYVGRSQEEVSNFSTINNCNDWQHHKTPADGRLVKGYRHMRRGGVGGRHDGINASRVATTN